MSNVFLFSVFLQSEMPPRISPLKDAIHHVTSKTDKKCKLEIKYINAVKGKVVYDNKQSIFNLHGIQNISQHAHSWSLVRANNNENYLLFLTGRGIFAKGSICKGDFVVEYRGDMISSEEYDRRRKIYHSSCAAFMFAFKWRGKTWW